MNKDNLPSQLYQIPDYKSIAKIILDNDLEKVSKYLEGQFGYLGYFMGKAMICGHGTLNPEYMHEAILNDLKSRMEDKLCLKKKLEENLEKFA